MERNNTTPTFRTGSPWEEGPCIRRPKDVYDRGLPSPSDAVDIAEEYLKKERRRKYVEIMNA